MENSDEVVLYEIQDHIATITLNRPDQMNAITPEIRTGVLNAFTRASGDEDVRVIVLTGAGEAFCAGGDMSVMSKNVAKNAMADDIEHKVMPIQNKSILAMHRTEKPIIAAINGPVAGGGMGMALASDIRIASESAVFSMAFARIGLHPEWGMSYYLPRIVGEDKAKELIWLAEKLTAEDALELGLATQLVKPDDLMSVAMKLARKLASRPPVSIRLAKKGLSRSLTSTIEEMLDYESFARNACLTTEDFKEGVAALIEKRKPEFKGR